MNQLLELGNIKMCRTFQNQGWELIVTAFAQFKRANKLCLGSHFYLHLQMQLQSYLNMNTDNNHYSHDLIHLFHFSNKNIVGYVKCGERFGFFVTVLNKSTN